MNLTYLGLTCWCVKPCSGKRVRGWQPKLHSPILGRPGTLCLPVTRQRIIERIWNDHFKLESYIVVLKNKLKDVLLTILHSNTKVGS